MGRLYSKTFIKNIPISVKSLSLISKKTKQFSNFYIDETERILQYSIRK